MYSLFNMRRKRLQRGKNLQNIGTLVRNRRNQQKRFNYQGQGFNFCKGNCFYRKNFRGRGFGSVFAGLSRFLLPIIQNSLKSLKSEAISAGSDIFNEFKNKGLEQIVTNRGKQAIQNLKNKAVNKIDSMMTGKALKKKKRKVIKRRRATKNVHKPLVVKRRRIKRKKTRLRKGSRKRKTKESKINFKEIFG